VDEDVGCYDIAAAPAAATADGHSFHRFTSP
jgi:hypothetical protein